MTTTPLTTCTECGTTASHEQETPAHFAGSWVMERWVAVYRCAHCDLTFTASASAPKSAEVSP